MPAWRATSSSRCHSCGSSSGPAATRTRDPVRRTSSAIRSLDSAGLTGAAIPTACAASVAAYSIEVLTLLSVTASWRRTPKTVSALAMRVTVPASSA